MKEASHADSQKKMCFKVALLAIFLCGTNQSLDGERKGKIQGRIYGGAVAGGTDFPWMASVRQYTEFICGGAIINIRTILTAAHCLYGRVAKRLLVRVGSKYVFKRGQVISVSGFVYHPLYNNDTIDYDIGLIRLNKDVQFSNIVQPVVLPSHGYNPPVGTPANISGWGQTEEGDPEFLHYAVVRIIDQDICKQLYKTEVYTDRMLCAGYLDAAIDTCVGDSGGPLVINEMVIGISSWASIDACGEPNEAGVYTRVSAFVTWIGDYLETFGEKV